MSNLDLDDGQADVPTKLVDRIAEYVEQSVAPNTRRAYEADWRHFHAWCRSQDLEPMPTTSETVAGYISAMASGEAADDGEPYSASTIQRRLTSIRVVHRAHGHEDPTDSELVTRSWRGIRRDDDVQKNSQRRRALLTDEIKEMVDEVDVEELKGKRDRAIILLGYATGARRSELAQLKMEDLEFRSEGLVVHIRSSKTDQQGHGRTPSVHYAKDYCPVAAVEAWIAAAGLEEGGVFRSVDRWGNIRGDLTGRSINRIVKAAARGAGLDASRIGAHSLRAGHVTQRKIVGDSEAAIMDQTGHKSESTMRRYDRRAKQFRHDVTESLDL